jgi:D-beta-D-heptose 7-phosphate kinase / D-beta-D-heptose 1-phosphate adenosyltransferase
MEATTGRSGETELASVARRFGEARVLVLGDVMLDRYVSGSASRLSPEAPIPVLRPSTRRVTLGGAANVARNVVVLGGQATLIGVIGEDADGAELTRLLENSGIVSLLVVAGGRPTTTKTRFMVGTHQLLRLDEESIVAIDAITATQVLQHFAGALPKADVVVLSDYAKGVLSDTVLAGALERAETSGLLVIADPKRPDFAAYHGATVLTPNENEVREATRINASNDVAAGQAGRRALDDAGCEAVLVTRSAKGVTLVQRDAPVLHLPTQAREVADVSGAGDTLVATLAVALGAGASLPEAAKLANITAGISVGKRDTATVGREELLRVLHLEELVATDRKVVTREEAADRAAAWRQQGLRVGFANGCFDLIHPGHVRLLAEARARCDRLIVALNTDDSVKRLKGPTRPLQNETARATVMASLASVDLVVLFAEDTPLALIEELRPDVLVKGADYRIDQVLGADLVRGWGGTVLLVELQPGYSTTGTIQRMIDPASA